MKWVKISERLPEKDGWYITWKPGYVKDNWDIDHFVNGRFIDGHGITHWAEITGPEDCCTWRVDKEYNAHTLCGTIFGYRNTFRHCPNCGRPIKEVKP